MRTYAVFRHRALFFSLGFFPSLIFSSDVEGNVVWMPVSLDTNNEWHNISPSAVIAYSWDQLAVCAQFWINGRSKCSTGQFACLVDRRRPGGSYSSGSSFAATAGSCSHHFQCFLEANYLRRRRDSPANRPQEAYIFSPGVIIDCGALLVLSCGG